MKKSRLIGGILVWTVLFGTTMCSSGGIRKQVTNPNTGKKLTLLIYPGISDDYTYVIEGDYKSNQSPIKESYIDFHDSFGITFNDSTFVIYYLGKIFKSHNMDKMNVVLRHLKMPMYSKFIDTTSSKFLYKYYF